VQVLSSMPAVYALTAAFDSTAGPAACGTQSAWQLLCKTTTLIGSVAVSVAADRRHSAWCFTKHDSGCLLAAAVCIRNPE